MARGGSHELRFTLFFIMGDREKWRDRDMYYPDILSPGFESQPITISTVYLLLLLSSTLLLSTLDRDYHTYTRDDDIQLSLFSVCYVLACCSNSVVSARGGWA